MSDRARARPYQLNPNPEIWNRPRRCARPRCMEFRKETDVLQLICSVSLIAKRPGFSRTRTTPQIRGGSNRRLLCLTIFAPFGSALSAVCLDLTVARPEFSVQDAELEKPFFLQMSAESECEKELLARIET